MGREDNYSRTHHNSSRRYRSPPHRSPHRGSPAHHSHRTKRSRSASAGNHATLVKLNREISSSRERSRARERRRRKAQAECIRKAGGFQKLADSENHETVSLFWDGFQWVAKTGQNNALQNDPALMNSTRKLRRLYFGNLPLHLGLTETGFQDIVWQEMKQRGFCSNSDINPVFYVWFAREKGNYGFVEFATVEETERALTMDGMNCMGIPLKVSRPNDYSTASVTQSQAMAQMGHQAAAMLINPSVTPSPPIPGNLVGSTNAPPPPPGPPPGMPPGSTKFMMIPQAVLPQEIEHEDEYEDILDDVVKGLKMHSTIIQAKIISPKNLEPNHQIGDILVEFDTAESLENCIVKMAGRKYFDRLITMVRMQPFTDKGDTQDILE